MMKDFWHRFRKNRAAVVGLMVVLLIAIVALIAPILPIVSPFKMGGLALSPPTLTHLMGTDDLGRDMMSRVAHGARISLMVGLMASLTSTLIGIFIGSLSGYYGGWIDDLMMRITELFQVIPRFFLALIFVAIFGPTMWNIIFVIGFLSWPITARLVRADFLSLKTRDFIEASRALGQNDLYLIFVDILPNATPSIIVNSSLQVAQAILLEAMLSFLGLGDPQSISWGQLLNSAQLFIRQAWWMVVFPGLTISITILGLNLVGDGLNDALNPRMKNK
jgi:peptide/nickel transport system permease protein